MTDTLLQSYVDEGLAAIGIHFYIPDGSLGPLEMEWPCIDMLYDAEHQLFAWWWVGDERGGHVCQIRRIEVDDYAVFLHDWNRNWAVELGPVVVGGWMEKVESWRKTTNREEIGRYLQGAIDLLIESPSPRLPEPVVELHEYQALLEWHKVEGTLDRWVLVAAWAANEDEIAIKAEDRYGMLETIEPYSLMAQVAAPLQALDYWWRQADEVITRRGKIDPVQAASARDAAIIALAHGQPKDYLDSEYNS